MSFSFHPTPHPTPPNPPRSPQGCLPRGGGGMRRCFGSFELEQLVFSIFEVPKNLILEKFNTGSRKLKIENEKPKMKTKTKTENQNFNTKFCFLPFTRKSLAPLPAPPRQTTSGGKGERAKKLRYESSWKFGFHFQFSNYLSSNCN